ncbi:DUF2851 family protein [Aquimarina muelleri]|uniref:DUF2851 domain-containing protein n=1 Tax=Aquimarina muelleri TaxID=279356 RepID=A0A918JSM1_9FLAO|nr:DUF2851 family protein [Aquimarina muelleri]MCX2761863.1 DUF2851 family protein [Aquimarina muelleri]GGX09940.1 hypothetical protein GCM10007384_09540 [Aquimarina muelleri]
MTEDLLQYLWKHKKFDVTQLKTTRKENLILQNVGVHNTDKSGPDFFNALLIIQEQKWAGNVEIHNKSSDWYTHNHENDSAYDNVILHVVWEDDMDVFRKDNSVIPTLQLSDYIAKNLLIKYEKMFLENTQKWIRCEKQLPEISRFILSNWQERLFLERLEQKSIFILKLLEDSANNWEAVLFKLLGKNFGLKVNGDAFLSLTNSIDFSIIRKCSNNQIKLEALFFGQAGLLENEIKNMYSSDLKKEYCFLKNKFQLNKDGVLPFHFFRLRPPNFPTIRLAQFAMLYFKSPQLFNEVIRIKSINEFYKLFGVETSSFWENHYTFEKESKTRKKKITKSFIDLLLINTIIPLKFIYARTIGKDSEEEMMELISQVSYEKNTIVSNFKKLKVPVENAMHSQALIQLKNRYCDEKACLKCAIGNKLLNGD